MGHWNVICSSEPSKDVLSRVYEAASLAVGEDKFNWVVHELVPDIDLDETFVGEEIIMPDLIIFIGLAVLFAAMFDIDGK